MGWTILGYLLLAWAVFEIFVGETYLVGTIWLALSGGLIIRWGFGCLRLFMC